MIVLLLGFATQTAQAADAVLRFSWWGGAERHEATLKAIRAFEAKNPGVTIKGEYGGFGGFAEKTAVQLTGGTEPDIMQLNWAWVSQFSREGDRFYDLKALPQLHLDAFVDEAWKTGMVKDRLNAVPVSYTARVFLWNKTIWERAGLALPKSWDDLFAAGKLFEQKLGKDYYPLDGHLGNSAMLAQRYMQQKTGKSWLHPSLPKVAFSHDEAQEWVRVYKRLVAEHVVMPYPQRLSLSGGNPEAPTEQIPDWTSGKIAGMYQWDSTLKARLSTASKSMQFEIGDFLILPQAKAPGALGRPALMLAVSRNSKHPELALRFVDWMIASPEAAEILGAVRGMPLNRLQREMLYRSNRLTPQEFKAMKQIESARIDAPSPLAEHSRVLAWLDEVFAKVAYGKISDQEAAKLLVNDTNQLLRRLK